MQKFCFQVIRQIFLNSKIILIPKKRIAVEYILEVQKLNDPLQLLEGWERWLFRTYRVKHHLKEVPERLFFLYKTERNQTCSYHQELQKILPKSGAWKKKKGPFRWKICFNLSLGFPLLPPLFFLLWCFSLMIVISHSIFITSISIVCIW